MDGSKKYQPSQASSKKEASKKAADYCAYQERSQLEVRQKLSDIGFYGDEAEEIIAELIMLDFLNEERFAKAFAGGKFRMKRWGKIKITLGLKQKGISDYCIRKGLEEIPDQDYQEALAYWAEKKASALQGHPAIKRKKLAQFLIAKGFEPELVWAEVHQFIEK